MIHIECDDGTTQTIDTSEWRRQPDNEFKQDIKAYARGDITQKQYKKRQVEWKVRVTEC